MLWMAVTTDKYELPVCVAGNAAELASKFGMTKNAVESAVCKGQSGNRRGYKFVKVEEIDDE